MPKKDNFHDIVKIALEKENWHITNDPLFVPTEGGTNFFIDLGVERFVSASKEGRYIAIEVKSFNGMNPMYKFYEMLGQFLVYQLALEEQPSKQWNLFIALPEIGFKRLENAAIFNKAIQKYGLQFLIINPISKTIVEWKK